MIRITLLTFFMICIVLGSIGCYTMISHPAIDTQISDQQWLDSHVGHVDDCASCHDNYNQSGTIASMGIVLPDDGYDYYDWEYYYDSSWWADEYNAVKNNERHSAPLPPTSKRSFTRPGAQAGPSSSMPRTPANLSKSTGGAPKAQSSTSGKRSGTRRNINKSKRKAKKTASTQSKKQE